MLRIGEGYAPWTWEEIEKFQAQARTDLWWAAAIALYSGQRQADVLGMLWSDIQEGLLSVTQNKTGKKLWIPMHVNLRAVLSGFLASAFMSLPTRAVSPGRRMASRRPGAPS